MSAVTLERDGFVVVEGVLDARQVTAALARIDALLAEEAATPHR